jgi:ABC-type transport system substrate-binding protein
MKKTLALVLAIALLLGVMPAVAEEEVSKYDQLTVSTGTPFGGNFFCDVLNSIGSDQDIRRLIHGYSLVYWDGDTGSFQFNTQVIQAASMTEDGTDYILALAENLKYNDGTPITARDYAFSLLLQGSPELREATGSRVDLSRIQGGRDYQEGRAFELAGVRILGDYQLSISLDPDFLPYFYQLKALDVSPMPISVIAPDCEVVDDGKGALIDGDFSAELLEETLLDPMDGYISHPKVTSGPYMLTSYENRTVVLELNPEYIGDAKGVVPTIPKLIIREDDPNKMVGNLVDGKTDLVTRCVRKDQIRAGMELSMKEEFDMKSYSRTGVSHIDFCAEKGATSDLSVRQALNMCLDRDTLIEMYTEAFGLKVNGLYGIGQWMFLMANGTLVPEEGAEEEWADLKLDGIREYDFDPPAAQRLLEENGWEADRDGLLSKAIDGEDVSMRLKLIYPEGNGVGPLLDDVFVPYLDAIGIELEVEERPIDEVVRKYYGQEERDCDMILIGTNFGDVYDPTNEYDETGRSYLNGITDPELRELAINMRSTEPGNATEYCRRWLAYQERLAELAVGIPLYSDVYFDFHIAELQKYSPAKYGSWALALPEAELGDYVTEEEEEEAELPDDDFDSDDLTKFDLEGEDFE